MIFEFKEYDGVNQTPAVALLTRGHQELLAQGLAPNELVGSWEHQAVVAFAGNVPVGVMTYTHEKWRRILWVHMGYVAPEARRRGVYRLMFERVVRAAQKLGAAEILGSTHVDNKAMLECYAALGRTRFSVTSRFIVPPAKAKKKA